MPLTLAQARPLSRVIETGIPDSDSRVVDRINEAVARLHAAGDFIGSVERYGVTVDPTTGEFERPAQLSNLMRVSELPDNLGHSVGGTLFSNDESAFVFNTASVLPVQQLSPTRFKVLGALPAAVDVMGKRALVPAVEETDELAITDVHAIKLMLLSLWREENNKPDLAKVLRDDAVAHLQSKTDTAVAEARRLNFTSLCSRMGENTFGAARAHAALAVAEGVRLDDHKFQEILNDAERRIMLQTRMWEPRLFRVRGGVLSLPYQYESVLKVDLDNVPKVIQSQWHEYTTDGNGYREDSYAGTSVIYRGESALHTDLPEASVLTVSALGPEKNVSFTVKGADINGIAISDTFTLAEFEVAVTTNVYAAVYSIQKDLSAGGVSVSVDTTEVAYLEPWQTESRVARYAIPDGGNCEEQVVRAILRPRWYRKFRDSDIMQVKNLPSLVNMVISVLAERAGDIDRKRSYQSDSVGYVEAERLGKESGHQRRFEVQNKGLMRGRSRRQLR